MKRRGSRSKKINFPTVARYFLGVVLLFFGLNDLVHFMTRPPGPAAAESFFAALSSTGYFIPFLGLTFIAIGTMLLMNRMVPLALVILAPISIQILLFHVFLSPSSILGGLIIAILNLYLGIKHIDVYKPMFK